MDEKAKGMTPILRLDPPTKDDGATVAAGATR
jgi:hypothetical protein